MDKINSAYVIAGEASETDSDDDNPPKMFKNNKGLGNHGSVVIGEDSESENEHDITVSSAESALAQFTLVDSSKKADEGGSPNESLLHKKLKECNHQLYVTLNSFCQNAVNQAGKTLSTVDNELVRSQVSLQSAITALRHLNNDSLGIQDQLNFITSSNFIANIKTN